VGLPVAVAFGKLSKTIEFDVNEERLAEFREGRDKTNEVESEVLISSDIVFTLNIKELAGADFHIVAFPTPVDDAQLITLDNGVRSPSL
jgi:UDP-N-acetyl-D-glucosamine/UDP-N-acetyl-D-galactosamine dehydrogenase